MDGSYSSAGSAAGQASAGLDRPFRLLVCGGRTYDDVGAIRDHMNAAVGQHRRVVVIHGGARGADRLAGEIAAKAGIAVETYPADWTKHGKAAGALRNQEMLERGRPDVVLAMPGGRGTADMVRRARAAGVRVTEVQP